MRSKVVLACIGVAMSLAGPPRVAAAPGLDEAVLAELNFARTRPADYAEDLRRGAWRAEREDDGSGFVDEDPSAVDEAIDFLERQQPLPPLRRDARLSEAARAYAAYQGPSGQVGHGPALGQRLQRHGMWAGMTAENISYGQATARDVVRQLIVDSRVSGRGHRDNIFSRGYQYAGVGCGGHRIYRSMCVIDFAGAVVAQR